MRLRGSGSRSGNSCSAGTRSSPRGSSARSTCSTPAASSRQTQATRATAGSGRPQPLAQLDLCRPDRVQLAGGERDLWMKVAVGGWVVTATRQTRRDRLQVQAFVPASAAELRPGDHLPPERKCLARYLWRLASSSPPPFGCARQDVPSN